MSAAGSSVLSGLSADIWAAETQAVRRCTQCGTCSAVCPLSEYMDISPRQLSALLRAGRAGEALVDRSIWVCTSCYACTVNCPEQIPVTEVIYGLKRASMRASLYPRRLATPVMARQFVNLVDKTGRSSETWLSVSLYLRTSPFKLVRYAPVALRLLRLGRLSLRRDSVRQAAQLEKMLGAVEPTAKVGRPI